MSSPLLYFSIVQNHYQICMLYCGESVSHHQARPPLTGLIKGLLNHLEERRTCDHQLRLDANKLTQIKPIKEI